MISISIHSSLPKMLRRFAPQDLAQGRRAQTTAGAAGWEDFHLDMSTSEEHTPRTHSTSTTMNSSSSYDGRRRQMLPRDNEDSPSEDGRDLSQLNGDMLKTYLTSQGQDEKLAVATAIAFENFLSNKSCTLTVLRSIWIIQSWR
jgi:hypothetical protein